MIGERITGRRGVKCRVSIRGERERKVLLSKRKRGVSCVRRRLMGLSEIWSRREKRLVEMMLLVRG